MMQGEDPKDKSALGLICHKLGAIEKGIDYLHRDSQKTTLALIGVIAASLGIRLVNSPAPTIIFTYIASFTVVFMLGCTVANWKKYTWTQLAVRLSFVVFILFSVIARTFVFESGVNLAPLWYAPVIDGFFIVICCFLIIRAWRS